MLTVRDCFQVCGLADLLHLHYKRIGRHYGKNKVLKVLGLIIRSMQMVPTVLHEKPAFALSHGSRSQLFLASLLKIPRCVMGDYEYTQGLVVMHPNWVIFPDMVPDSALDLPSERVCKYSGLKEDVYVPNFEPDPSILRLLDLSKEDLIVTIRPPATEAHYHNPKSEVLFESVLQFLSQKPDIRMVILPRTEKQGHSLRTRYPELFANGRIIIPKQVVNGLNLIWHSDLVISGGGTMNREAAALDVPVYSIFQGTIGAVDRYLAREGRLSLIKKADDIPRKIVLEKRSRPARPDWNDRPALRQIVNHIEHMIQGGR